MRTKNEVNMTPCIVLFYNDFRLDDNRALFHAAHSKQPVIPVFIQRRHSRQPGRASQSWLYATLLTFQKRLQQEGLRLIIRKGDLVQEVRRLISETSAKFVYFNRNYSPECITEEQRLSQELVKDGVEVKSFKGNVLNEPWAVSTKDGGVYKVFTPYYNAALQKIVEAPLPRPKNIMSHSNNIGSLSVDDLGLPSEYTPLSYWNVGEEGAIARAKAFDVEGYHDQRDYPALEATSQLSAYIHFGEISVGRMYERWRGRSHAEIFLRQLYWRDFATSLLFHFPKTAQEPLRPEFNRFPWRQSPEYLACWKEGKTGYPMVDAAMRELLETGWMHNRSRMIVGSFLVKHLRIHWMEGERWFWQQLFDADSGNNIFGWQWVAGCGADAAPYFRIFNPISQGEKFDPEGKYIKKYVPELGSLKLPWIHKPWMAAKNELEHAGVRLGATYPVPLVDHSQARAEALEAFQSLRH